MSGRCNTLLYSSESHIALSLSSMQKFTSPLRDQLGPGVSMCLPLLTVVINVLSPTVQFPFFQSIVQHLTFRGLLLPLKDSYCRTFNNYYLTLARRKLSALIKFCSTNFSNPFHLFELCQTFANVPKGEIRGGIHREFPSCFALDFRDLPR